MKQLSIAVAVILLAGASVAAAQPISQADAARADAAVAKAFPGAPVELQSRHVQDETLKQCSLYENLPPKNVAEAIQKREKARIEYPADGKLMGDWKSGEKIAQSGYGLRFSDYPPRRASGGNCYACHQLTKAEVSYGTVGPTLLNYGKNRKFGAAETKAAYEKIYNAQAAFPCSNMPRLGTNKILTVDQIKDLVALVMSPDSPVNK
jgi:sulfur-oxidizing protein SoxX